MKQIILMGDLTHWKSEAEFIIDMLHFTATRVVTINLGLRPVTADLNRSELRQLFPGNTLDNSVSSAITKLYSQGIADGILCLVNTEHSNYVAFHRAFEALPFGMPKIALVSGNSTWRGKKDIVHVNLPGTGYNLNPVIKICLCNIVFAISGMSLCNIHNFGSSKPTVGAICCNEAGKSLTDIGTNFISFDCGDEYLGTLIRNGYIHGLLLGKEFQEYETYVEMAVAREIPVVIGSKNPEKAKSILGSISLPVSAPVAIITTQHQGSSMQSNRSAASKTDYFSPPAWLKHYIVPHKYGTEPFFKYAAKTISDFLK